MKSYNNYMENIIADDNMQKRALDKITELSNNNSSIEYNQNRNFDLRFIIPAWARVACLVIIACIALSGTALAVIHFVQWEPVDIEQGVVFTIKDGEIIPLYHDLIYGVDYFKLDVHVLYERNSLDEPHVVNIEIAEDLRSRLESLVFTEDGKPFDLFVPVPGGYIADDRGFTLYMLDNAMGEEYSFEERAMKIKSISYTINIFAFDGGADKSLIEEPYMIMITPELEDYKLPFMKDVSYEEAVAFLGRDFRMPTKYIENFSIQTIIITRWEDSPAPDMVSVGLYGNFPSLMFSVQASNEDGFMYIAYGELSESIIGGVTVFRTRREIMTEYYWEFDGLIYRLYQWTYSPSPEEYVLIFTDEQIEDIIRSMIE